jgi:hypothetical protein
MKNKHIPGYFIFNILVSLILLVLTLIRPENLLPAGTFYDDSFFYLSIAKNISAGRVFIDQSGQFINGFQPLYALLLALVFAVLKIFSLGANPYNAIRCVYLIQIVLFTISATLFGNIVARFSQKFAPSTFFIGKPVGYILGCAFYFANWQIFFQSLNGLETGLLIVLFWTILYLLINKRMGRASQVFMSFLLGLFVLTRIDGLIFALVAMVLISEPRKKNGLHLLINAAVFSVTCGWWFLLNWIKTGNPIPSSGLAYMPGAAQIQVLDNMKMIFQGLTEASFIGHLIEFGIKMIHSTLVETVFQILFVGLLGIAFFYAFRMLKKRKTELRSEWQVFLILVFYAASVLVYYPFFYGASWFMQRYIILLVCMVSLLETIFLMLVLERLLVYASRRNIRFLDRMLNTPVLNTAIRSITIVPFLLLLCLSIKNFIIQPEPLFTYVDYYPLVRDLPPDSIIGSSQSGLLSYFMPGIINLDGKMNASAVQALRSGSLCQYILANKIEYLLDTPQYFESAQLGCLKNAYAMVDSKISRGVVRTILLKLK